MTRLVATPLPATPLPATPLLFPFPFPGSLVAGLNESALDPPETLNLGSGNIAMYFEDVQVRAVCFVVNV